MPQAQTEYESKIATHRAKREVGRKPGGKNPEPPTSGPQDKDQINLTDEESRIMKVGGGFDQCYNAQAAVDTDSMQTARPVRRVWLRLAATGCIVGFVALANVGVWSH